MHNLPTPANDVGQTVAEMAGDLAELLNAVPELTDMPSCLCEASQLLAKVRFYGRMSDTGRAMMGPNGIGPQIVGVIESAARYGFDWRERL